MKAAEDAALEAKCVQAMGGSLRTYSAATLACQPISHGTTAFNIGITLKIINLAQSELGHQRASSCCHRNTS